MIIADVTNDVGAGVYWSISDTKASCNVTHVNPMTINVTVVDKPEIVGGVIDGGEIVYYHIIDGTYEFSDVEWTGTSKDGYYYSNITITKASDYTIVEATNEHNYKKPAIGEDWTSLK